MTDAREALLPTLHTIRDRVAKARKNKRSLTEEDTKVTLITPLLRALGWNAEDFDEVRFEYRHKSQDQPVDYALFLLRTPTLFVEAKSLDKNLDNHKWLTQTIAYASAVGVTWCVLTNGNEYRIYNAHAPVEATKKLFRTLKIDEHHDDDLIGTLELLTKTNMGENTLNALWDASFIDRQVKDTLEVLFGTPDASLVRLIKRRTSGLTNGEITKSLQRANVQLDFPVPLPTSQAETEQSIPEQTASEPVADPRPTSREKKNAGSGRVTLADVIAAGVITAPLRLEKVYKGEHLSASIQPDGTVRFDGEVYPSPSTAAGYARNSVIGVPADGRSYWQTNGWWFWKYRDSAGELVELDTLRQRYLAGR